MNVFKRFFAWLKASNRLKHLAGGIAIGAMSNDDYCAALCGIGVASALELKDRLWGGKWDWTDWAFTVLGVAIGRAARIGVMALFKS